MKLYRDEKQNSAEVLALLAECDTISYNRRKNTFTFYACEGAIAENVENVDNMDLVKLANALEKRYFMEASIGFSGFSDKWNWDDEDEEDEKQEDEPKAEDQATETKKEDKPMKKRYFYLADIDSTVTVEQTTKKELISIADGLKSSTFCEHYDTISGYTKGGKFFYYDCTNFWDFKKSDILDAVSVVYSHESGYAVWGAYVVNEFGVVSPTDDGQTLIWNDDNIKEVDREDYHEDQTAEEPATDQEPEEATAENFAPCFEIIKPHLFAKVEHVGEAVPVSDPANWSTTGCKVRSENVTFRLILIFLYLEMKK